MISLASSVSKRGPKIKKCEYAARIQRFWQQLEDESVAIITANPGRMRTNDSNHSYRQSSDLLYLNGFPEPQAVLIVTKLKGRLKKRIIMLVRPKDRLMEVWTGIRIGKEGAVKKFLAQEAHHIDEFEKVVGDLLKTAKNVYYRFGLNKDYDEQFGKLFEVSESKTQLSLRDPLDIIHEMRLVKSPAELSMMRHSAEISAQSHCAAMKQTKPGMTEQQLQAILEGSFMFQGSPAVAYGSIVAGGNNAVILHYVENADKLKSGDLVLVDAAGEYKNYASDITRCWPVSGKFSEAQREIYEIVLAAEVAAIKAVRAGAQMYVTQAVSEKVMAAGLVKLGILPARGCIKSASDQHEASGKAHEAPKPLELKDFFMHGTSHYLGMDVHDVGRSSAPAGRGHKMLAKRRTLEPGMVLTVEPGLYFDKNDERVPEKYRGIGIRIEDDVIVTEDGCEVITASVPKTVNEIERLMASA